MPTSTHKTCEKISVTPQTLAWQPLFTTTRSGLPELTTYGVACVIDGQEKTLVEAGHIDTPLWSRSLLKPWQLMSLLPDLQHAYPHLTDSHWALMTSSHQGDTRQLDLLFQACDLTEIDPKTLQCPVCYPMAQKNADAIKSNLQAPQAIFHPCGGKHLAHLLYCKQHQLSADNYLDPTHPVYQPLKTMLKNTLGRDDFNYTVDGCGMPNPALSARELCKLYAELATSADLPAHQLFREHPLLIGGQDRLDTQLIQGQLTTDTTLPIIAKEGADGLLGVGIGVCQQYPSGLGILIKLASGYDSGLLELMIRHLLHRLDLTEEAPKAPDNPVLERVFH